MNRRTFVALAATGCAASVTQASDSRVVGIVSLVADYLTVTGFESTTGTNLSANPTERIELQTDDLERAMLRAGLRAVNESRGSRAVPLLINDGALYDAQRGMVDGEDARLPASLLTTLQAQKATHLLLMTKHRAEARMKTVDGQLGTGRVEGLGFYVDRVTPLRIVNTSEVSVGYIAPHVYVRLSLIDLRSSKVVASRPVLASRVISAGSQDRGADPWNLLDSTGKMKALQDLIAVDCEPVLRTLLAS